MATNNTPDDDENLPTDDPKTPGSPNNNDEGLPTGTTESATPTTASDLPPYTIPESPNPLSPDSPDWANSPPPDPLSLSQRRKSAQLLAPIWLGPDSRNSNTTSGAMEQAQLAGINAYAEFLESRLNRETGISDEWVQSAIQTVEQHTFRASSALSERNATPVSSNTSLNKWRDKGRLLLGLAKSFENSPERRRLRSEAEEMASLGGRVTREKFMALLEELFESSVSVSVSHRILVLFTFISDVIVICVRREGSRFFTNYLDWALDYITDRVSALVVTNGGWDAILSQQWRYIAATTKLVLAGIGAYIVYRLLKSAIGNLKK